MSDPRRRIPRTDDLLARPVIRQAAERLGVVTARDAVRRAQAEAREGRIAPEQVAEHAERALADPPRSRPVLNATGIVVHTNLGRAPLSPAAVEALIAASGYTDVELDLGTGRRARRGAATLAALRAACPAAEDALVVNNGAAALVLATTALAAGKEVVVSRGELVEIGDGFRLPDLIASTGARLREVGTTNRTHLDDYADAIGPATGCILKVHPSNFWVSGFTSSVELPELAGLGVPVIADLGSGLLEHDPALPEEPDAASALTAGADLVTASGDKLLGGPQAGLLLGRGELIERLRRHPLARALRVDKLTLAALQATLAGPVAPVTEWRRIDPGVLRERCDRLAAELASAGIQVEVVESIGHVGGGGAPGVPLPGWAVALEEAYAEPLRTGAVAVLARTERGRCLVDPRCIPPERDPDLIAAIGAARGAR
ncbi:L-seryl-tRNA(Sec) selenium transferase [Propionibacteriaceae bacterium ES.041]|uniref:L-seryl-tRNA(Sec) selenium transferase n=1 Tax=Enemella evansiae TaxID=2016499 RepID=UPI000C00D8B5|nr:L-seryl-tRNA(Sec) selenium transferase [Enemella evansiae]PFG66234.1 L-seryl-tRNA(Sec) selenium transferase [Propionibacteriaceae bacterium ES.041]